MTFPALSTKRRQTVSCGIANSHGICIYSTALLISFWIVICDIRATWLNVILAFYFAGLFGEPVYLLLEHTESHWEAVKYNKNITDRVDTL